MCIETINATANVSTNVSTNVSSTASIDFYYKKVRYKIYCYILHKDLLVVMLLFVIVIICYRYAKHSSKLKILTQKQYKMENNQKKLVLRIVHVIISMTSLF